MTKYVARPVIVTAHRITEVRGHYENGNTALTLENGELVEALKDMTARMQPVVGDYWVVTHDGYTYLNPKQVFELKYKAYPLTQDDYEVIQGGVGDSTLVPRIRTLAQEQKDIASAVQDAAKTVLRADDLGIESAPHTGEERRENNPYAGESRELDDMDIELGEGSHSL